MHEYWAASSPKLFYHPSMEELAHRIQAHCESYVWSAFFSANVPVLAEPLLESTTSDSALATAQDIPRAFAAHCQRQLQMAAIQRWLPR